MEDLKKKLSHAKDKVIGQGKEVIGKALDDNQLELKGKLQGVKADLLENIEDGMEDVKDGLEDLKEGVAKKLNQFLDKKNEK